MTTNQETLTYYQELVKDRKDQIEVYLKSGRMRQSTAEREIYLLNNGLNLIIAQISQKKLF